MMDKFKTAEDAFFWFMRDDVPFMSGRGLVMARIITDLRREHKLLPEHLFIMDYYAKKGMRPNASNPKEGRSAKLWNEAMDAFSIELERKGLVEGYVIA